jgi:hypothetical protein
VSAAVLVGSDSYAVCLSMLQVTTHAGHTIRVSAEIIVVLVVKHQAVARSVSA